MLLRAGRACVVVSTLLWCGCEFGVESTPTAKQPPQTQRLARGHLRFVEGFEQGYAEALRQQKPMLIFFTAEWCHYCHQLADEAFTNPQVVSLSERFVCILVDGDAEPDVCRQFQVTGFPTIQFVSPRGVQLDRLVGKRPGHQLMMAMQAALQDVARRDAPETLYR